MVNVYALINTASGVVENTIILEDVGDLPMPDGYFVIAINSNEVGVGWSYADGVFVSPPEPILSDDQIISTNLTNLSILKEESSAQKTSLVDRISVLADAADIGMSIPEEDAEKIVREKQLIEWKRYAVLLGRVTDQDGWPMDVKWPEKPELFHQA